MKIKPLLSAKQLTPLIEILIVITFFSGTAVILAQIFAKAYNDSLLAHDINSATLFVGECAERIRASEYETVFTPECLPGFEKDAESSIYRTYIGSEFEAVPKATAYAEVIFDAVMEKTEAGSLLTGTLICTRVDGTELISIKVAVYYGN